MCGHHGRGCWRLWARGALVRSGLACGLGLALALAGACQRDLAPGASVRIRSKAKARAIKLMADTGQCFYHGSMAPISPHVGLTARHVFPEGEIAVVAQIGEREVEGVAFVEAFPEGRGVRQLSDYAFVIFEESLGAAFSICERPPFGQTVLVQGFGVPVPVEEATKQDIHDIPLQELRCKVVVPEYQYGQTTKYPLKYIFFLDCPSDPVFGSPGFSGGPVISTEDGCVYGIYLADVIEGEPYKCCLRISKEIMAQGDGL